MWDELFTNSGILKLRISHSFLVSCPQACYDFRNSGPQERQGSRRAMMPGQQLRAIRESLGLTLKDVESASAVVAGKYENQEYSIPASRLSEIETKGMLPSIYRVYSLALLYRKSVDEILSIFGIPLANLAEDISVTHPPKTHIL